MFATIKSGSLEIYDNDSLGTLLFTGEATEPETFVSLVEFLRVYGLAPIKSVSDNLDHPHWHGVPEGFNVRVMIEEAKDLAWSSCDECGSRFCIGDCTKCVWGAGSDSCRYFHFGGCKH